MRKTTKRWVLVTGFIILTFGVGIYLQDLKHHESTTVAWQANHYNMERFNKIREYANEMTSDNWLGMRDSIKSQMDSLMILRFRKEMNSLNKVSKTQIKKEAPTYVEL